MSEANRQALATLDSAMFVLCLDDAEVTNEVEATHTLLHNYGANRYALLQLVLNSHGSSVHRWFDKSFNLIVTKNGLSAINFEHSWGDGVAVLRFFNELYKYTTTNPYIPSECCDKQCACPTLPLSGGIHRTSCAGIRRRCQEVGISANR